MIRYFIIILLTSLLNVELYSQSERFNVSPAPFSSRIYDEFSPVFYDGGIVFISNLNVNPLISYQDDQKRLFNIVYITRKGSNGWTIPQILSEETTTEFHDGPVTFNESGNVMYFSRNNSVENSLRNISNPANKLGIYSAELINGEWTNIKPFAYNNPLYSFTTPALTPDGQRLYFCSDMPGGSGGMDLYYCDRLNNDWDQPVNLGPVINTEKNESFPFAGHYGKLFFASDGHNGYGGKDIYYTQEINGKWINPVHLEPGINSTADDFGLVTDSTFNNGYFSTNRRKTDDIFIFSSEPVEFSNCRITSESNYCYTFYDKNHHLIDNAPVTYKWDFGDGTILTGKEVSHCFPGPGNYSVMLNIFDDLTDDTIAWHVNHKLKVENIEQAYINSADTVNVGDTISFEGIIRDLRGIGITDYFWDFGDGFKTGGPTMNFTYKNKGEYTVRLGLFAEKDSLGEVPKICVLKKIIIN